MMTAGQIMDFSAAMLNDPLKKLFTYNKQLPYLQIALQELKEECEIANIPNTNKVSAPLTVSPAMRDIGGPTGPPLPTDLIEPLSLWERQSGTVNDFTLMTKREFLPETQGSTAEFMYWTWNQQMIEFIKATGPRDVKIHYTSSPVDVITDDRSQVVMINCATFLEYRTAALVARFVGQNKTRADELDSFAVGGLERALGIDTKGKQAIATRRRPFRAAFKSYSGY
jgi:hypothetical protein